MLLFSHPNPEHFFVMLFMMLTCAGWRDLGNTPAIPTVVARYAFYDTVSHYISS